MNAITPHKERVANLKETLEKAKARIAEVIPRHVTAERMCKTALIAANKTPELYECTQLSFVQSVMTASELGLDVSGTLGSAYLLPFNCKTPAGDWEKRCQLIIGYRGMIDLALRSGKIASIQAYSVYEKDSFKYELGLNPVLVHVPYLGEKRGKLIAAYSIAETSTGARTLDLMSRFDIDDVRARSKAGGFSPWETDFPEMAKKTVVRRHCKYLPQSPELEKAMLLDVAAETGEVYGMDEVIDTQATSKTESVKAKIGANQEGDNIPGWDPNSEV